MTENEMVGRHHRLNGQEFEQSLGDSDGQGSLACLGSLFISLFLYICGKWSRHSISVAFLLGKCTILTLGSW